MRTKLGFLAAGVAIAGCNALVGNDDVTLFVQPSTETDATAPDAAGDEPVVDSGDASDAGEADAPLRCEAGSKICDGKCVPADPAHGCGAASCSPCAFTNAAAVCDDAGACARGACASGYDDCNADAGDGCETHVAVDPNHCGSCTNVCSSAGNTPNCGGGKCSALSCNAPFADCNVSAGDGCEINTSNDKNHCGACGHKCGTQNGASSCAGSACSFTCTAPYTRCPGSLDANGCDINLHADTKNCGSCGHACSTTAGTGTAACSASGCTFACTAPFAHCPGSPDSNGCNINTNNDSANCGGCGNNCAGLPHAQPGTTSCNGSGTCVFSCAPGYANLDGIAGNGCESTLPTGVPEAGNLVLWLRADTGWNGSTWTDSSGGGRHASVYYGQPGTGTLNGKNVVNFNGGELLINAGFPAWSGLTVFAVANTQTDDAIITMGVSYNPGCTTTAPLGAPNCVPYDMLAFGASMSLQQCDPSVGSCWQAYSPGIPLNTWMRSTAWESPSANPSFRSYFNGVDNGVLGHNMNYPYPPPWNTPRKDTILGWRNYRGQVAELVVFNTGLSDASRVAVDQYLATKWNVR